MTSIIEIEDLSKQYGRRVAVENLNLQVDEGDIYGFVGPNGAGKTSTIRIIVTLLQPTSGKVWVAGNSVSKNPREVRKVIGYMPDFFGVYTDMKVWEYLDFFGACYRIPQKIRDGLINDLLELVDLEHRRNDMVDTLSRGMKQRLSLARTLVHDPDILVLDEPASGLDPRARVEIRELLLELSRMGKTIFFSTHILADVAQICTNIGIIEAGRLVATGKIDDLQQQVFYQKRIRLIVLSDPNVAEDILNHSANVENVLVNPRQGSKERQQIDFTFIAQDEVLSDLLSKLISEGVRIISFSEVSSDIEEVFMQYTKGLVT
jgi:ABC-2 type transport system ATP-binding protein